MKPSICVNTWFEEQDLLHNIYNFQHLSPSTSQDSNDFIKYLRLLVKFATTDLDISKTDKEKVKLLSKCLDDILSRVIRHEVLGEFGCALIGVWNSRMNILNLSLFFPDGWRFGINCCKSDCNFVAKSSENNSIYIGEIPGEDYDEYIIQFHKLLAEAKKKHAEKRNAGHNVQGHQKTPSFIEAVLKDTTNSLVLNY